MHGRAHGPVLAAIVACCCCGLSLVAQTRPAPARTAAPTADVERLRALRLAFEAARPFEVSQASMGQLVAQGVALPPGLTPDQRAQMQQIALLAKKGVSPALRQSWGNLVAGLPAATTAADAGALMQWVLREAYLDAAEDLRFCADKLKFFKQTGSALRAEIQSARSTPLATRNPGSARVARYLKRLEALLQAAGDDADLANAETQDALQEAQEEIQQISAVSKLMSDTSMSTVRKIGG